MDQHLLLHTVTQLAAVLLCQLHQVKVLFYTANITSMSDYSLVQELFGLYPSFLSLSLLALSVEPFSNLDEDSCPCSSLSFC